MLLLYQPALSGCLSFNLLQQGIVWIVLVARAYFNWLAKWWDIELKVCQLGLADGRLQTKLRPNE